MALQTTLIGQAAAEPGQEAARLTGVLTSDAAEFDKAMACRRLAVIGGKRAVPALAVLLADKKLATYARTALESIPDSAADDALRDARLALCVATQHVIANGLSIIGVSAPDSM